MYYTVNDLMQELFLFTWFLMLVIGMTNFLMYSYGVSRVMDKIREVLEAHEAEKAELQRALERRRGR